MQAVKHKACSADARRASGENIMFVACWSVQLKPLVRLKGCFGICKSVAGKLCYGVRDVSPVTEMCHG